jgi:hypothetical protein
MASVRDTRLFYCFKWIQSDTANITLELIQLSYNELFKWNAE